MLFSEFCFDYGNLGANVEYFFMNSYFYNIHDDIRIRTSILWFPILIWMYVILHSAVPIVP